MSGLIGVGFGNVVWGFGVGLIGLTGWWAGFWGSVGCARAWGFGFGGWEVVLGLGGSVLGSRGMVLGLIGVGFGNMFWGFGQDVLGWRVGGSGLGHWCVALGHGGLGSGIRWGGYGFVCTYFGFWWSRPQKFATKSTV